MPVISVLVSTGDTVEKDAPLVELESEKATMEVPATTAGRIRDVKVRVGDKVSQGDVLAIVETQRARSTFGARRGTGTGCRSIRSGRSGRNGRGSGRRP